MHNNNNYYYNNNYNNNNYNNNYYYYVAHRSGTIKPSPVMTISLGVETTSKHLYTASVGNILREQSFQRPE